MGLNSNKKNILIIGGSGFIGTPLIKRLLDAGYSVKNYDKKPNKNYPNLTILGDINNKDFLTAQMKGIDIVYNLAAEHRDDVKPKSLYYKTNVDGAYSLIYAAEKNNINTIIFTSSVAVYGLNKKSPSENSSVDPFNDYAKSKYQAEQIYTNWAKQNKNRILIIIRTTTVFGEGNQGNIYNLIEHIINNRFIMIGTGTNKKSLAYVENVAEFLLKIIESPLAPGLHLFNYTDKPDLTMNELINIIYSELEKKKPKIKIPYIIGFFAGLFLDLISKITGKTFKINLIRIKKFCASTQFSTEQLSKIRFIPPYTLEQGLKRTIKSIKYRIKIAGG